MLGVSVEFTFDLPPEMEESNVDDIANEIVERAADSAREEWMRLASERLTTTFEIYRENLSPVERPNNFEAVITLTGDLPNMLEQGKEAFDMKPGILNGPNAKISAKGSRYQDIRFAHGSPTQSKIKKLPKELFKQVNTMQLGQRYSDKNRLKNWNMGRPGGYEHKTGIYDDLHKARNKGTGLTEFQTFRRVSENSDPSAFIHPGLKALNLAEKVKEYMEGQIDSIIDAALGKGMK